MVEDQGEEMVDGKDDVSAKDGEQEKEDETIQAMSAKPYMPSIPSLKHWQRLSLKSCSESSWRYL